MPEELHELHEHAEHARHDPSLAPVSITMAILAVLVSVVSLAGHRAHTHVLLRQSEAADTWAQYQAQSIRRHNYELFLDLLNLSDPKNAAQAESLKQRYQQQIERYQAQQKELSEKAREKQAELVREEHRANRFDLGEVCLEAALVIVSMTLLTGRRRYWKFGLLLAVAGVAVAVTGFFVR
jgi:hypothetical protein